MEERRDDAGGFKYAMLPPPPRVFETKVETVQPPTNFSVAVMCSPSYVKLCSAHSIYLHRDVLFWSLAEACGLTQWMRRVAPMIASMDSLLKFHSKDYLAALQSENEDDIGLAEFELENDCALFDRCWDLCRLVAGASLTAADELVRGTAQAAINWGGGRHHAKKSNASGFCYVNDVVLSIQVAPIIVVAIIDVTKPLTHSAPAAQISAGAVHRY